MVGKDKRKLGVGGQKEEDDEGIGEGDQEGGDGIVGHRALGIARLVHILRGVAAIGVDSETEQNQTARQLQPPPVLLVVDKIHHIAHAVACNARIDNVAQGSTHSCDEPVPTAFVQRALHTKHAHRTHRSRCNDTDEHPLEDEIEYVDMDRKWHNGCKIANFIRIIQVFGLKSLFHPAFFLTLYPRMAIIAFYNRTFLLS